MSPVDFKWVTSTPPYRLAAPEEKKNFMFTGITLFVYFRKENMHILSYIFYQILFVKESLPPYYYDNDKNILIKMVIIIIIIIVKY